MSFTRKAKKLFLLAQNSLQKKAELNYLLVNKQKIALFGGIIFSWILISLSLTSYFADSSTGGKVLGASVNRVQTEAKDALLSPIIEASTSPTKEPIKTPTPTQTPTPTPKPTLIPTKTFAIAASTPTPAPQNSSQYTAKQLNSNTWKVDGVSNDDNMATADEIVNALNSYRGEHGRGSLSVDSFLSSYAKQRADLFASNGGLDGHAGFESFMANDGFSKAGFNSLGENSAYISGPMNADKIIRQIFGADASHDGNQLDNWTHVGVGVNGNAINVNFGKGKR